MTTHVRTVATQAAAGFRPDEPSWAGIVRASP